MDKVKSIYENSKDAYQREMKKISELKGKCPNYRTTIFGYILINPPRHKCSKCGSKLKISKN
jgi:hypothetical protein